MTKPQGCEYNDNEYHGPPITNPNPGKGASLNNQSLVAGMEQMARRAVNAMIDEPGPGSNLLNVMPTAPALDPAVREQAYREMDLAWRQTRLTDYNRLAAHWGLPQLAQVSEQSYRTDAMGRVLAPQAAQDWQEYENRQRAQAGTSRFPFRVTDDSVDALQGAFHAPVRTPEQEVTHNQSMELARRLNRSVNEAVINGYSNPQPSPLFTSRREQYPNPELVMQQRKAELADLYIRHGSMVPPWVTVLNPMYRGVHLNNFTRDDWFTVLGQVALTLEQGRGNPHQPTLTEAGRAILHVRQDRILRRCSQLGIPLEMVIEPGHEDHFNGRPIVEYSEGVFNQLLDGLAQWPRRTPEPGDRPERWQHRASQDYFNRSVRGR